MFVQLPKTLSLIYLSVYQLPVFYHLSIQTSINSLSITYISSAYLYIFIYTYTYMHTHIYSFLQPLFYERLDAMSLGDGRWLWDWTTQYRDQYSFTLRMMSLFKVMELEQESLLN